MKYKGLVVREEKEEFRAAIEDLDIANLPDHDVLIRVTHAALNFKDALSTKGHKGITRNYPHTPGVDAAGIVVEDRSNHFKPGQKVICTSFDLGMNTAGGFGEYIRVPSHWVVPLPEEMSLKESMILGTAAYTAGLAIHKMEQCGQKPELGEIVVTGASGGVGSMAVALLNRVGYDVLASTGKSTSHEYLKKIGAKRVVSREDVNDTSGRPLLRSKWAGAIDNVGGNTLATLIKACGRNGSVASIGLVDSPNLETTVYPFILNGVNLLGIDSAETPLELRHEIWRNLGGKWKLTALDNMCSEIGLDELISALDKVHRGESVGRIILKHSPHLPA